MSAAFPVAVLLSPVVLLAARKEPVAVLFVADGCVNKCVETYCRVADTGGEAQEGVLSLRCVERDSRHPAADQRPALCQNGQKC